MAKPDWINAAINQQERDRQRAAAASGGGGGGGCLPLPVGCLGFLVVVFVLGFCGYKVLGVDKWQAPGSFQPRQVSVVQPDELNGRARNTDKGLDEGNRKTKAELRKVEGAGTAFSAAYGRSSDDLIVVGAASGDFNDPLVRARQLLVDVTDNRITGVKSVDAGSLGGGAKCGEFTSSGIRFGACAWVDEASIGVLIFYGSDADKAAAELADTRAQIEKVA